MVRSCLLLGLLGGFLPIHCSALPKAFNSLFDGQTLTGWKIIGGGAYSVDQGSILGETGDGSVGWLVTEKVYGDFVLELDVRTEMRGNSGIQIRSQLTKEERMVGYQIEIDSSDRSWSGGLYDEGRRGWIQNLVANPEGRKAFKFNRWNRYRIVCMGDSIKSWINDCPITDAVDPLSMEGIIALQIHAGDNVRVLWRNIRIQELGRHRWIPLWDGRTFDHWRTLGRGTWRIHNGVLSGEHAASEPAYGHLICEDPLTDFTVRLKYKAIKGNSGLYFRIEEKGFSGVTGFQAEIDAVRDAGGLYETNGRGWVVKPSPKHVNRWFKPQAWNQMSVSAHGRRITVHVNGFKTAELLDDPGRREGFLALQLHGGQDVHMQFKDIELLQSEAK